MFKALPKTDQSRVLVRNHTFLVDCFAQIFGFLLHDIAFCQLVLEWCGPNPVDYLSECQQKTFNRFMRKDDIVNLWEMTVMPTFCSIGVRVVFNLGNVVAVLHKLYRNLLFSYKPSSHEKAVFLRIFFPNCVCDRAEYRSNLVKRFLCPNKRHFHRTWTGDKHR